jgi:hypothetical protein
MLRVTTLILLALGLTRCSSQEDPQETSCEYQSQSQKEIKLSTTPQTMNLPFDQQKIISLLWTPTEQSECFLTKNGSVKLYKLPNQENRADDTFVTLKPATSSALENWSRAENSIEATLLGLTTVSFLSVPQEKIVDTQIVVRSEGRPWHLWHEYVHFLIAQTRVAAPDLLLDSVTETEVSESLDRALAQINNPSHFQELFLEFSNLQLDYLQKAFVEEIVIESTLLELTAQAEAYLTFDQIDRSESLNVIVMFYTRYDNYLQRALHELLAKTTGINPELQTLVDQHQKRLIDHQTRLKSIIP